MQCYFVPTLLRNIQCLIFYVSRHFYGLDLEYTESLESRLWVDFIKMRISDSNCISSSADSHSSKHFIKTITTTAIPVVQFNHLIQNPFFEGLLNFSLVSISRSFFTRKRARRSLKSHNMSASKVWIGLNSLMEKLENDLFQ